MTPPPARPRDWTRKGAQGGARAAGPPRRTIRGLRWWMAALLMGVTIVNYLDRTCLAVTAPVLERQLSLDANGFADVVIAFQLAYLVMQPLSGRVIDWLNVRLGLALSLLVWSAAQMLTALAGGWVSFAFFRALLGVGEAANFPAGAKAVSEWFPPKERTLATGVFNVGAGVGQALAAPLVVFLMLRFDWQTAFVATGAIGVAWAAVWWMSYRTPDDHPRLAGAERALIRADDPAVADAGVAEEGPAPGVWRSVIGDRNFWAIGIARFLSEPAWQFFTYWIPLYLVGARHVDMKALAYFAWVPFVAADFGCLFGGALSPMFMRAGCSLLGARKRSALVCAALMIPAVFIGRAPTAAWAVVFFSVAAFAHQAMSSTLLTLPADVFPTRAVATANGLSGSMAMLGGMLSTKAVGVVVTHFGYGPLFPPFAVLDLVGTAFLWTLLREPLPTRLARPASLPG